MQHNAEVKWKGEMAFKGLVNNHEFLLDADEAVGGNDSGPRPKNLVLACLAGCTGMDVVAILNKMQVAYEGLKIEVSGDLTEEHPKYYHKIHIIYRFKGNDLPPDKLARAVELSQTKYCGVSFMLKSVAEITYEIVTEAP